jgi:cyclophilin family peptidyl-prolyl cis-trans isomerase
MVSSDKRQRHKEGHRNRVQEAQAAQAKARRRRNIITIVVVAVVVIGLAIVWPHLHKAKASTVDAGPTTTVAGATTTVAGATTTSPSATTATTTPTASTVSVPVPAKGASITGATPCPKTDGSSPRTTSFAKAPPTCIDKTKTYTATVTTTAGSFTISLDSKHSPITVNNFVVLSLYHFYDGISFHRIVPDFMDQIGDPTETGTGGPGYDLPYEAPYRSYKAGDVAMARSSTVSGSQLFLTVDPTALNQTLQAKQPAYPILGTITQGMDIVKKIDTYGTNDENGEPTKVVTITSIKISAS